MLSTLGPSGSVLASSRRFAAGVAFYPVCSPAAAVVSAPLLVLVGALDDWTPASDCQATAATPRDGGASLRVMVFPGAHHAFNGAGVRTHPRDVFGHDLEYNETATEAANKAVAEFLSGVLKR